MLLGQNGLQYKGVESKLELVNRPIEWNFSSLLGYQQTRVASARKLMQDSNYTRNVGQRLGREKRIERPKTHETRHGGVLMIVESGEIGKSGWGLSLNAVDRDELRLKNFCVFWGKLGVQEVADSLDSCGSRCCARSREGRRRLPSVVAFGGKTNGLTALGWHFDST